MRATISIVTVLASLSMSACSMTTAVLHEDSPVQVAAARPAGPEPEPPPRVAMEAGRIRVDEKIHFETASADISGDSDGLLREIAQVMNDNAHVRKVRIEGHTDNQGAPRYNLNLSRQRARAVMARLVENGVARGRLEAEGYGLTRPVETNDTDAGRAANRRVEFNITEQDEAAADEQTSGGAQ